MKQPTCMHIAENFISRATSRKFLVFVAATGLTLAGLLAGDQWTMIAMLYTGAETLLDRKRNVGPQSASDQL